MTESSAQSDDDAEPGDSDRVLAARIKSGDEAAFGETLNRYWPLIALFVGRLLDDRETAADLSQETFIRLWQARANLETGSLRAFLYTTARNLAMDELRKRSVRARWALARGGDGENVDTESPERVLERQALMRDVARAIAALSPRRRQAFTLAFLHGLPYKEVAGIMGVSTSTVKNQISAALAELRTALAQHLRY